MKLILNKSGKSLLVGFLFFTNLGNAQKTASEELEAIINTVEEFKLFDYDEYPLGRYLADFEKQDADFAKTQLSELQQIAQDSLTETEQISWELLRFRIE